MNEESRAVTEFENIDPGDNKLTTRLTKIAGQFMSSSPYPEITPRRMTKLTVTFLSMVRYASEAWRYTIRSFSLNSICMVTGPYEWNVVALKNR